MGYYQLTESYSYLYNNRNLEEKINFYDNLRFIDELDSHEIESVMESALWELMDYGNTLDEAYDVIYNVFSQPLIEEIILDIQESYLAEGPVSRGAEWVGKKLVSSAPNIAKRESQVKGRLQSAVRGIKNAPSNMKKNISSFGTDMKKRAGAALSSFIRRGAKAIFRAGKKLERSGQGAERTTAVYGPGYGRGGSSEPISTRTSGGAKRRAIGGALKGVGSIIRKATSNKPQRDNSRVAGVRRVQNQLNAEKNKTDPYSHYGVSSGRQTGSTYNVSGTSPTPGIPNPPTSAASSNKDFSVNNTPNPYGSYGISPSSVRQADSPKISVSAGRPQTNAQRQSRSTSSDSVFGGPRARNVPSSKLATVKSAANPPAQREIQTTTQKPRVRVIGTRPAGQVPPPIPPLPSTSSAPARRSKSGISMVGTRPQTPTPVSRELKNPKQRELINTGQYKSFFKPIPTFVNKRGETVKVPGPKRARKKGPNKDQLSLFAESQIQEILIQHLFENGYADSYESAASILENISEDFLQDILEQYID